MTPSLNDLDAVRAVAEAGGYRRAARVGQMTASRLSDAVRRVEQALGVRLFHRTTRSVAPTEAGRTLLARLGPALAEVDAAMDAVNAFRETPRGLLRLNVPVSAARVVLPTILPAFLRAYSDIRVEITAESNAVDIVAGGADSGIRYEELLAPDIIALPIGPREQRLATAASPDYLARHGQPSHPSELLNHACLRNQFGNGNRPPWTFQCADEEMTVDPRAVLTVNASGASELLIDAALAGSGIVRLFDQWLAPHLASERLVPVLEDWWPRFPGPFLYYPGRQWVPAPLRAFVRGIEHS